MSNDSLNDLIEAALAVVQRWDSPIWKDVPHTGVYIDKLRKAIAAMAKPTTDCNQLVSREITVPTQAEFKSAVNHILGVRDTLASNAKTQAILNLFKPHIATREPVSVDLEKCKRAVLGTSAVDLTMGGYAKEVAKSVLDAAKEQGARFEYVD